MNDSIQKILAQVSQQLRDNSETPTLDAQVLVAHILERPRYWVLAHPEACLNELQANSLALAVKQLELGEPLPYVIGHWEFFGLDFHLTPDVLIPRPETELLVERGIDWLHLHPLKRRAIDVGTGSGCIGIALALKISDLQVLLTDISPMALSISKINAEKFNLLGRLQFCHSDLLEGVAESFDLICANLPYIPTQVLHELPVFGREPHLALDGGNNGIEVISRFLNQASSHLSRGGLMLLEVEASQGSQIKNIAQALYPDSKVQILPDLSGRDRCLEIELPTQIIHICQRNQWLEAQERGVIISQSLNQNGFIHCSLPTQILQVANRFFRGTPDLILLWIAPEKVNSEIRWESTDGELFPHVYGPIDLAAVISVTDLKPEFDGNYRVIQTPD
jgi:release factor glutamine methyltransferase